MSRASSPKFEEVAVLRHPDGPIISITKKVGTGLHSFSIMKVFEKDGTLQRTAFLNRRHLDGIRQLLNELEEWLDTEAERGAAQRAAQ